MSTLSIEPSHETFNLIMSGLNGDVEVGRAVCDFINACFIKRTQALSEKKENDLYLRPSLTITRLGRNSKRPTRLNL